MASRLRDLIVTTVTAVCVAGPAAGVALPLMPSAWRRPSVVWAILLVSFVVVAGCRHRRRPSR